MSPANETRRSRPLRLVRWVGRLIRLVLILIVLVAASMLAVGWFGMTLPLHKVWGRLQPAISKALRADVTLDGDLLCSVHRLREGRIRVAGLRITDPDPGSTNLVVVGQADVRLALAPLLSKQIFLTAVELNDTTLTWLGRTKKTLPLDEKTHAPSGASPTAKSPPQGNSTKRKRIRLHGVDTIKGRNLDLTFALFRKKAPMALQMQEMEASAPAGHPIRLTYTGTWDQLPAEVFAEGPSLGSLTRGDFRAVPFAADLEVGSTSIQATGTLGRIDRKFSLAITGEAKGENLMTMGALFRIRLIDAGPFQATTGFQYDRKGFRLRNIDGEVEGIKVGGDLDFGRDGESRSRLIKIRAEKIPIDTIERILETDIPEISGEIGAAQLTWTEEGANLEERRANRSIVISGRGGGIQIADQGPFTFPNMVVDEIHMEKMGRQPLRVESAVVWAGTVLKVVTTADNKLPSGEEGRTLNVRLTAPGMHWDVSLVRDGRDQFLVDLSGDRLGALGKWIGVDTAADFPYAIQAQLARAGDNVEAERFSVDLGRSDISGSLQWQTEGGIQAALRSKLIDVQQLAESGLERLLSGTGTPSNGKSDPSTQAVTAPPEPARSETVLSEPEGSRVGDSAALWIDMPVLKKPIRLPDVQFDWELENFGGSEAKVTDVALRARLRGGNIEDAGIRFNYGKTVFEGSFDVGLATDPPRGGLNVVAGDVDIGDLLRLRGLARNMEISARRLSIRTAGQGATVRDLLDWLTFDFEADEVRLVHSPPDSEEDVEVTVAQLSLRTHQGKPIRLEADARLLGRPVSLILESAWKADREDASMKEIPLHLGLFGETASLDLDAQIRLPFDTQQQSFALDFQAEDLAELPTPGVQLPSAGPIGLRGILTLEPDRYRVEDLSFRLGESQLKGHFDLQTAGEKSRLDADLRAPLMRIDDFQFEDWRKGRTAKAETPKAEPAVATLKEPEDRTRMLRHLLDSWEGAVSINLEDVRLGEETLGAGHLAATLKDGVLELAPLRMEGVAGDAELLFSCAESDEEVRLDVGLLAEDYDLGPLARGLDPKTELAGKLLLEAHVGGVAPDWTTLPAHLNGALVLGLFPDEFDATLLDFWGANVFAALMRRSDDPRRSRLNCLLGKFRLEEGRAQDAHLIVDTTRVRAEAKGWVDLGQERFGVELRPQSKRASFFSLLTPVGLQGSFEMPTVDVKALDIAGTAVGFVFSVITVPFERMFTEGLPRDGADVCEDTLQRWRSEAGAMSIASMAGGGASLLSIRGGPAEEVRAGGAASSGPTREESRQP